MTLRCGWSVRAPLVLGVLFVLGCGSSADPVEDSRSLNVQSGDGSIVGHAHHSRLVRAHAAIAGAPGSGVKGEIRFTQIPADDDNPEPTVSIVARITGLSKGAHGFHIHEVGMCAAPTFLAAGGHFDPGPFGNSNPDANHPFHMGDVPNLVANKAGIATFTYTTSRITLSPGPLSVFDGDGSAVIVHLNRDQGITGAAGSGVSGGPRIACGVIELDR